MVTPVILTYNEESNLETTLASLVWAPRIVLLDSGSTDRTEEIARAFKNTSWFVHAFENHRAQWLYAIQATSIATDYVLALDADMRPGPGFCEELQAFLAAPRLAGALVPFEYRILGRSLQGSIYPAQMRVFRKAEVRVEQLGHTQVFRVPGPLHRFKSMLIHEDQKPIGRWITNQVKYAALEVNRIMSSSKRSVKDHLRLVGISPAVWGAYAYLKSGGPLNSRAARAYACERLIFEAILVRLLAEEFAHDEATVKHEHSRH